MGNLPNIAKADPIIAGNRFTSGETSKPDANSWQSTLSRRLEEASQYLGEVNVSSFSIGPLEASPVANQIPANPVADKVASCFSGEVPESLFADEVPENVRHFHPNDSFGTSISPPSRKQPQITGQFTKTQPTESITDKPSTLLPGERTKRSKRQKAEPGIGQKPHFRSPTVTRELTPDEQNNLKQNLLTLEEVCLPGWVKLVRKAIKPPGTGNEPQELNRISKFWTNIAMSRRTQTLNGVDLTAAPLGPRTLNLILAALFITPKNDAQAAQLMDVRQKVAGGIEETNANSLADCFAEAEVNDYFEQLNPSIDSAGQTATDFAEFKDTLHKTVNSTLKLIKLQNKDDSLDLNDEESENLTKKLEAHYRPYRIDPKTSFKAEKAIPYGKAGKIRNAMIKDAKAALKSKCESLKNGQAANQIRELPANLAKDAFAKVLQDELASDSRCNELIKEQFRLPSEKAMEHTLTPLHTLPGGLIRDADTPGSPEETPWKDFKTCHHYQTGYPINAWKSEVKIAGQSIGHFYRAGTFAPQKLSREEKPNAQLIANQRAKHFAAKLASDYFSGPAKHTQNSNKVLEFNLSNLNLMQDPLIFGLGGGERKLTRLHENALKNLNGRTLEVRLKDGTQVKVKFTTRAWRQDPKQGAFIKPDRKTVATNRAVLKQSEESLKRLIINPNVSKRERIEALELHGIISTQLKLQNRWFSRWRGAMDPYELSAVIVKYEMLLNKYEAGAMSEGCKSNKDRGGLVDATTRTLMVKIALDDGRVPYRGDTPYRKKGGWMIALSQEDPRFRDTLADVLLMNQQLQKINTGTKGYITDRFLPSYIEDLAARAFELMKETSLLENIMRGANFTGGKA